MSYQHSVWPQFFQYTESLLIDRPEMMSSFQLGFLILLSSAVLIIASSSSAADAQQEIIQSIIHHENVRH
jgi:hypothetical protein